MGLLDCIVGASTTARASYAAGVTAHRIMVVGTKPYIFLDE
jgi:hypothetical protein